MMLYPAMSDLLKQVPSRYQLVNVVAARARQVANEAEAEQRMLEDKPVSIAVREIAAGHLPSDPSELVQPYGAETEEVVDAAEAQEADEEVQEDAESAEAADQEPEEDEVVAIEAVDEPQD